MTIKMKMMRKQFGWSQDEVAEALGVEPLTVGRWERGEHSPSRRHRQLLCQIFGVDPERLGFPSPPQAVVRRVMVMTPQRETQERRAL